jgi:hypothetical protein
VIFAIFDLILPRHAIVSAWFGVVRLVVIRKAAGRA